MTGDERLEHVRRFWYAVADRIGGFPREHVAVLLKHYEPEIRDENSWFYHEELNYEILPLLIPRELRQFDDRGELGDLFRQIHNALKDAQWMDPEKFDWLRARNRIEQLIQDEIRRRSDSGSQ